MRRGFRTKFVGADNNICNLSCPEILGEGERRFLFAENNLDPCKAAVLATVDGKLVGFLRFETSHRTVYALGTWVHRRHRGQGIAGWMWGRLLRKFPGYEIVVTTISRRGSQLVWALKQKYPGRRWAWYDLSDKS